MPFVKWNAIPPVKGPDSQGVRNMEVIRKTLALIKSIWVKVNEFLIGYRELFCF